MVGGVPVQPGAQIVGFDRHRGAIALGPDPARLAERPVERGDLIEPAHNRGSSSGGSSPRCQGAITVPDCGS